MPEDHRASMSQDQPPGQSVKPAHMEDFGSSIDTLFQWTEAVSTAFNDLVDKQRDLHRRVSNLELYIKLLLAAFWVSFILMLVFK